MVRLESLPSYTIRFTSRESFSVPPDAVYLYGESVEHRSHLPKEWVATQGCSFVRLEELDYDSLAFKIGEETYQLRSRSDLRAFADRAQNLSTTIYLDITGLSHHVWAAILTEFIGRTASPDNGGIQVMAVYVEPSTYTRSAVPRPGDIFALSERLHGLRPLPGLARLRRLRTERSVLVALLGFEGWRFDSVLARMEPDMQLVVPIIGVPGFRAEYPFFTLEGNSIPLEKEDLWMRHRFATANDPFEVFQILDHLQGSYPEHLLRIALVGTKPHALGAVIFHAVKPEMSELIYDNPVRRAGRTDSDRTVLCYDISRYLEASALTT